MTAEIAIINRGAVTLATDSAVTLTVRGSEKIYNCADKLFELSNKDPIGVMIYNSLSFAGIPLEVAIKEFRQSKGNVHQNSVQEAADAFLKYLQDDLKPSVALQLAHARSILQPMLSDIEEEWANAARRDFEKHKHKADLGALFTRVVTTKVAKLEALPVSQCFANDEESAVAAFYADTFESLINEVFADLPLEEQDKVLLRKACVLALIREEYSEGMTGFVFAGFGKLDMFPALFSFDTDGVIFNKLKKRETKRVLTNREEITGEVIPFAQREMVDRFLYGIDPVFEAGIARYLKIAIEQTGKEIIGVLNKPSKATRLKLNKAIQAATNTTVAAWTQKMAPAVKDRFMQEVQDMIFLMPKPELATLAQELINLTSVKRRFSSGRESVGGPIDVAVISRIDGFVWVRRKYYFDPNLNPRYFHRKFGQTQGDLGA